jgi:hypothetical protein
MKKLLIERGPSTDQGTFGRAVLDAHREWYSLELPSRDNSPHYSCILPGIYIAKLDATSKWSPRDDGRLYRLLDVPGRDLIKIHAATWAGDVLRGWHSELLGCIALGKDLGQLQPPDLHGPQECLLKSRAALTEFMAATNGEDLEIEVVA